MQVAFVANEVTEERQYALILVMGGDEAFNRWNTLESHVEEPKVPEQA